MTNKCDCGVVVRKDNVLVLDNVCHGEIVDSCRWCGKALEPEKPETVEVKK